MLITGSLMLGVYAIVEPAARYGWGAGRTLGLGAAALGLLVAFVVREATARNPLVPLGIFRSRNVSGANAIQALAVAATVLKPERRAKEDSEMRMEST